MELYIIFVQLVKNPGFLPKKQKLDIDSKIPVDSEKRSKRFCEFCNIEKPIRTHHCKICEHCVLRMDHHCPFIASCVGKYNHRYFVLFLLYCWLGICYGSLMSYNPFKRCYLLQDMEFDGCKLAGKYTMIFPCTLLVLIPVGFLLIWQLYVGWTGMTTVEILIKMRKSKVKHWIGGWIQDFWFGTFENYRLILGTNLLESLLQPWKNVSLPKTTK